MSYAAYYALSDAEPVDGDALASTTGWFHWCNSVMAEGAARPELAHLACFGWSDNWADLEHEAEQFLHAETDPDLSAITAGVLAAVRARPAEDAVLVVSDGEPAGGDAEDDAQESREDLDPLAALLQERVTRKDGETWQVGSNWYTKKNGKIRKTAAPQDRANRVSKANTLRARRGVASDAAAKLAAGGADLTHDDVVNLDDHFESLPRDKMREVARQIGLKVGGLKHELAARIIAEAKARVAGQSAAAPTAPAPKPEPPPAHPAASKLIDALNAAPGLSDAQREEYGAAVARVTRGMPQAALDRVANHVGATTFYASTKDIGAGLVEAVATQPGLTAEQSAQRRQKYAFLASEPIGGAYMSFPGGSGVNSLHLDGAQDLGSAEGGRYPRAPVEPAHGIYAHELGHAVDGPGHQISGSAEWQTAYAEEIGQSDEERRAGVVPRLSWYGGTKASEGLAEFARLVYGSDVPHAQIARDFPRATAVFRSHGLWPETERTAPAAKEAVEALAREQFPEIFLRRVPLDEVAQGAHADVLADPLDPAAVALALAQLRADGDDEAAAEVLHMLGESDVAPVAATEAVVREHQGAPPFPGAVFDTTSHRWKNPHTGEEHPADPNHPHAEQAAATRAHDAQSPESQSAFQRFRAGVEDRLSKSAGGRVVLAMGRGGVWLFHQVEHRLLYAAKKTQEVAVAAAKERGLDPDRTEKLKRALYLADFLGGYATGGAALAVAGPIAGKVAAVLPSASVAYLAYSTAKDPAATWRAAKKVMAETFAKGAVAHESVGLELATRLAELLRSSPDPDWLLALFHAALAHAGGDAEAALAATEAALRQQPTPPE